jgi:hypothetical protein
MSIALVSNVGTMVAGASRDISSPIQVSKLQTDMPTPLGDNIARDRSENPFFEKIIQDDETGLLSIAYKAIGVLTVMVPVAEFNKIITLNTHGAEWRKSPSSNDEKKGKSRFLRRWVEDAIPAHLAVSFDQNFSLDFLVEGKKSKGRPRKHPYLVGVTGYCKAKKDGCETKFIAGFTEASLRKLMNEDDTLHDETIELSVDVTGSCVHVKDKTYGALRGKKRQELRKLLARHLDEENFTLESRRTFINEYELLGNQLDQMQKLRSQKNQKPCSQKKRKHVEKSQDVLTQQAEEEEDESWSRAGSSLEVETSLRNELLFIFTELGFKGNKQAHSRISECFSDTDNIAVMSYCTFNNFMMNHKSQSRNGLKPEFRKGLQAFVSKHTALSAASATAADRDPEGPDRLENPFFEKIIQDDETGLLSIAYKAIGILTVMVPVAEFNKIIALNAHGAEWRKSPTSDDEKQGKSRFFRRWIEETIPAHLAVSFDQNFSLDFLVEGKKSKGRPRKHPYLVGVTGHCSAKKDGCETQFIAGFTEASLRKLMNEDDTLHDETIELSVDVTGSCVHVKDKTYGALKGIKRQAYCSRVGLLSNSSKN